MRCWQTSQSGCRRARWGCRLAFGTLALLLVGAAGWIGATWIDVGDSTCGAVYRPDLWWGREGCDVRMGWRALDTAALAAVAVGVFLFGLRTRPVDRGRDEEPNDAT